ncbi:MAG: ABC transporter permease subunit [Nitrosarchaeum sp.]|nr:ABC transporter permease subunit [Nitrosarchaeum sp.]
MTDLFELRGILDKKSNFIIEIVGFISILILWILITSMNLIPASIFPSPLKVITSFKELHFEDFLVTNAIYSIKLNFLGYIEAVLISILIGFPIGLFPVFRSLFSRYVNASRFIPLTAITGVFIAWFGIETNMKVQFLAFGIIVYMLPVIVQRIDEVENVYLQTAKTLGASRWQMIRSVFMPSVFAKISDDIRVLVAISWTYIIVAELVNRSGGIGAIAYTAARQSRIDKVFAVLLVIILIGFVQDRIFIYLDKKLFPYKHI